MPIVTRIQPKYLLQKVTMLIICVVFSFWGFYDYTVKHPAEAEIYARGQVYRQVYDAMIAFGQDDPEAAKSVRSAMTMLADKIPAEKLAPASQQQGETDALTVELDATDSDQWIGELILMGQALGEIAGKAAGSERSESYEVVSENLKKRLDVADEVAPPSTYDWVVCWAFMACLPFAPWIGFQLWGASKRVYRLDEDGRLTAPEGAFEADQIKEIDMSRWMSKSIATVITDGPSVRLDDYVYKNVDLIVGTIAAEKMPDAWTTDAKPIGKDEAADSGDAAEEEAAETREAG